MASAMFTLPVMEPISSRPRERRRPSGVRWPRRGGRSSVGTCEAYSLLASRVLSLRLLQPPDRPAEHWPVQPCVYEKRSCLQIDSVAWPDGTVAHHEGYNLVVERNGGQNAISARLGFGDGVHVQVRRPAPAPIQRHRAREALVQCMLDD